MARVLITGMSGTGKSTLLAALADRGYATVDTDDDGWTLPNGLWDAGRMFNLLNNSSTVVVSGTVENQGDFYGDFECVVLLAAPLEVLLDRVTRRANNPYGRTEAEREDIARYTREVEPLLRRSATVELDAREPTEVLADAVERLLAQ
jgi:dephospho-CoA kinase